MLDRLEIFFKKEQFQPSFFSIFINPSFFIRRGIYRELSSRAGYMNGRMLDFGCGSKPYEHLFNVKEYIGLDIEKSGHCHSKEKIDIYYDGRKIPFADNYFDSAFSSEVFEHVFNLDEILDELYRVLRPGAYFLITIPFVWDEHEIPYDFARYTSFGIKHILEQKKFRVIDIAKSTNYVETVFQMWNAFISQFVLPSNKYLKLLLTPLFISPITILGIILSKILPDNRNLYLNNVIVALKEKHQ